MEGERRRQREGGRDWMEGGREEERRREAGGLGKRGRVTCQRGELARKLTFLTQITLFSRLLFSRLLLLDTASPLLHSWQHD